MMGAGLLMTCFAGEWSDRACLSAFAHRRTKRKIFDAWRATLLLQILLASTVGAEAAASSLMVGGLVAWAFKLAGTSPR